MFSKLILEAVIRSAVYFEKSSWKLYRDLFEKARDPEHRELFERMAREEEQHIRHLADVLRRENLELPADADAVKVDLADFQIPEPVEVPLDADYQKILESMIAFEEMTVKFYELAMARTPIRAAKRAFAFLVSEEAKHLAALKEELGEHLGSKHE